MKKILLLSAITALAASLSACGGKSDPIEDYRRNTKNAVPTEAPKAPDLTYDQCGGITVVSENVSALEGKTVVSKIVLANKDGKNLDQMSVVSTNDDDVQKSALTLRIVRPVTLEDGKKGTEYSLTFTAPKNFIPVNKSDRAFSVILTATELLRAAKMCPVTVNITVKRAMSIPSILAVSFPRSLQLESLDDQTILVDVAATDTVASDLVLGVGFDRKAGTATKPVFDMSSLIAKDAVATQTKDSRFRFALTVSGAGLRSLVEPLVAKYKNSKKFRMLTVLSVKSRKFPNAPASRLNMVIEVSRQPNEAELAKEAKEQERRDAASRRQAEQAAQAAVKAAADATAAQSTTQKHSNPTQAAPAAGASK